MGDLFDLHPAFGRSHDGDAGGGAVDQQAEIQLALDVAAFLDIEPLDFLAGGTGLLGHEDVAQHFLGVRSDILDRLDDADAALAFRVVGEAARTSATGMDLGLDHIDGSAQFLGNLFGLGDGVGDAAARHRHTIFFQQVFGLVFMDIHGRPSI